MAAPNTLKSDLDADVQVYYNKKFVEELNSKTMYYNHCDKQFAGLPLHHGQVVEFDRYNKASAQTTALPTTSDANGVAITRSKIRVTMAEYGSYTVLDKIVSSTEIDENVKSNISKVMTTQAALSLDTIVREVMLATAQIKYANGKAAGTIAGTDVANISDIKKMAATFRQTDVMPFEKEGMEGLYHFICSPLQAYDIKADTTVGGFIDINKYHNSDVLRKGPDAKGLVGVVDGVAIYETSLAKAETINSIPCHNALMLGDQAYACPMLDGDKLNVVVTPPQRSLSDIYGRFTTIGWTMYTNPAALDDTATSSKNKRAIVYKSAYTNL